MSQTLAAPAIFLFTMYLILARPRNLDTGIAALLGAGLALLAGVVTLSDVATVAGMVWNATFALIAIVVISVVLDGAGFFRWAALHMARIAGGDGRTIFLSVILLGALVSTLFTNDATVLILTPIVFEMLAALGFNHRMMLPYMIACGFVADSMSIPLAVSNLTNMIAVEYFHLDFARYALVMLLPSLASLAATMLVLRWYYRQELPERYDQAALPAPATAIKDPFLFRVGMIVLAAMVVAFFINSTLLALPVSFVIAGGAAVLLLATLRNRVVRPVAVLKQAPWHVVAFALGMYLVVFGFGEAGLTRLVAGAIGWLIEQGLAVAVVGTGTLVALLSSVMNNLPGVMIGSLAVDAATSTGAAGAAGVVGTALREGLALANVVGAGIGPKLTPIGSLATLIWLHALQRRGMQVTWQYYLRVGLVITPPVLLATLAALWLSLRLFG